MTTTPLLLNVQRSDTLREVTEQFDLVREHRTLAAFNLFGGAKVCQVHARGVRLLEGTAAIQVRFVFSLSLSRSFSLCNLPFD
jgi:type IV secretory pathway TrbD component